MAKLTVENDWENLTFFLDEVELSPNNFKKVKIYYNKHSNTSETFEVDWIKESVSVCDMGQEYKVTREVPVIKTSILNVPITIKLEKFKTADMELVLV